MKRVFNALFMVILVATPLEPLLAMNKSTCVDEQQMRRLAEEQKFTNHPGQHTRLSPLPGSRQHELEEIRKYIEFFQKYQKEVYKKQNVYVIPIQFRARADAISKDIFLDYISKYHETGISIDNVVGWNSTGLSRTDVSDVENKYNTWNVTALVAELSSKSHIKNFMYRPAYVVALHETMHVEEAEVGISEADYRRRNAGIDEVLTVTKTLILLDKVYKETMNIPLDQEVDYGVTFEIFGKEISQGQLAKFYGALEPKYKNLAEALTSAASLDFLGYATYVSLGMGNSFRREQHSDTQAYLPCLGFKEGFLSSFEDDYDCLPKIYLRPSTKSNPNLLLLEGPISCNALLSVPDLFWGPTKWVGNPDEMQRVNFTSDVLDVD